MKSLISILFTLCIVSQSFAQPVWNFQNSGTTSNLNDINNLNEILFAVGDNGVIRKSSNEGFLWELLNNNTTANLNSIETTNRDTIYIAGAHGTIIKSNDQGITWTAMTSNTTKDLNEIKTFGYNKTFAVGEDGTLLRLQNNVWINSQIDTADLNSIFQYAFNKFIVVGNSGTILQTTDNGLTWNRIISHVKNNLNKSTRMSGLVVGDGGISFQTNGNTLTYFNSGTKNNLYSVDDENNNLFILACGESGTLQRSWNSVNTTTQQDLNSLIQTNLDNCFVVGNDGIIIHTNDINVTTNSKKLNSDYISAWYFNNGIFNHMYSNPGFEWPKGEDKYARYTSGIIIGAITGGDTLVTICFYETEFLPGYTDNKGIPNGNGSPEYRNYKMVYGINDSDRIKWPNALLGNSDQGAPVYFDSSTITYKPNDYGNQTMFYSYTDSYMKSHTAYGGRTAPLKADVRQINFSFNQPEELRNVIYQEYRIINKSNSTWVNAYINFATDDDIGISNNDAVGVDTLLRLAYTYNLQNEDPVYGINPPAVGFVIIRAPFVLTGNNNDTVFYYEGKNKKIKIGFKETNFNSTVNFTDDVFFPNHYSQSYNAIRGLKNDGNIFINPTTNQPTKFVYSGDPETHTG